MRTTLNLAEDILLAVKERARCQGRSAGEVLSELSREALTHDRIAGDVAEGGSFAGFEPLPSRGPAVSNDLIDRLLEDETDLCARSAPAPDYGNGSSKRFSSASSRAASSSRD